MNVAEVGALRRAVGGRHRRRARTFLVTFVSIAGSLAVGSVTVGWWMGALFCSVVLAHEAGHYVVARVAGLHRSGPIVVFPLGGCVVLDSQGMDRRPRAEASIILAGPLCGGLCAWLGASAWWATSNPWFYAFAIVSIWVNLLNLLPVGALDGGRLARLIRLPAPAGWLLSAPAVAAIASPIGIGVFVAAAALGRFDAPVIAVDDRRAVRVIVVCGTALVAVSLIALKRLLQA